MPIAELNGASLHYETQGQGTPLVLLLPQSSGPRGRQAFVDGLASQHQVITYDQRGTGQSSPAAEGLSMAQQAADVIGLLDALGLDKAHVLCHSTGCGIGLSLVASDRARVDALILVSPWTYADAHLSTMQNLRKAAARALDPVQYAHFNAALLFPPQFRRADQAGFDALAQQAIAKPQDADMISRRLDAILAFDARPLLPSIRNACLLATAQDDQLMPNWFAQEAAAAIEGAELLQFDGGGHMLPETRTAELVAAVLTFVARNSASSA